MRWLRRRDPRPPPELPSSGDHGDINRRLTLVEQEQRRIKALQAELAARLDVLSERVELASEMNTESEEDRGEED